MAKNYRKRFHVDINTALSDLQAIGVEFTQEYLEAVKRSEEERIRQKSKSCFNSSAMVVGGAFSLSDLSD